MKNKILKYGAGAMLLFMFAAAVPQAEAQVVVVDAPIVAGECLYDAAGIPIWGYGTRGRAIYAYSPEGLPVYAFERVYSGCYVPNWGFHARYHGPRWPRGIHMRAHGFRPGPPPPGFHGGPRPPHHGVHHRPGPGPRPGAHHRPGPGGHGGPGGHHRPGPGGPGGHGGPRR